MLLISFNFPRITRVRNEAGNAALGGFILMSSIVSVAFLAIDTPAVKVVLDTSSLTDRHGIIAANERGSNAVDHDNAGRVIWRSSGDIDIDLEAAKQQLIANEYSGTQGNGASYACWQLMDVYYVNGAFAQTCTGLNPQASAYHVGPPSNTVCNPTSVCNTLAANFLPTLGVCSVKIGCFFDINDPPGTATLFEVY